MQTNNSRASSEPDIDARIALVIGKEGPYTDEFGFIHPGRVFGAFAEEEHSYRRLAEKARSYFVHLLPAEIPDAGAALLILPAVTIASLDRPLLAHRCARETAQLLAAAAAADASRRAGRRSPGWSG